MQTSIYSIIMIAVSSSDNLHNHLVAQNSITAHTTPLFSENTDLLQ